VPELRLASLDAGEQDGHTEGSAHCGGTIAVATVAELDGQGGDGLGAGLDGHALVVDEPVVLALHAGALDQGPGIGHQAGGGASNVLVHLHDLLHRAGDHKRRCDALLHGQDNAWKGITHLYNVY